MMLNILIVSLLSIIPCTGDLVTPNPDNDLVCWQPLVDEPQLAGYAIFWRDTSEDSWVPVGEVEADFNWWKETPMMAGEYCVKSINLEGLLSDTCSNIAQWDPCAQWNVDIEMLATPCVPNNCFVCEEWGECSPDESEFQCCNFGHTAVDCVIVTCPPPIPADWPPAPCGDTP